MIIQNDYFVRIQNLKDTSTYAPYRFAFAKERRRIHNIVDNLLNRSIIKSSTSLYAYHFLFCEREQLRICIDLQSLNNRDNNHETKILVSTY